MVDADDTWSVRATRGPVLTVLALACLASFGHGLFGRGELLLSPPQREPTPQVRAEAAPLPQPVDPLPSAKAATAAAEAREAVRPAAASPQKSAGAAADAPEEPAPALAHAADPVASTEAAAPAASDAAVPAAEASPAPEPPEPYTPPL